MKKNIGQPDKIIRLLLAAVLAILVIAQVITGTLAILGMVVAAVLAATALVNVCPLYAMVGLSTAKKS